MSSEPACKIWWHLCIIGAIISVSLLSLYTLYWTNTCRANELAMDLTRVTSETKSVSAEILRRLDRIERKIDGDTK